MHGEGVSEVPVDETNLAWRAVLLLADRAERDPDVRLLLRKDIPVAGGMAGAAPTPPPRWSGCPPCGSWTSPATSWPSWPPSWAATSRSRCTAAPRSAPDAASGSCRCWPGTRSTGCSPSPRRAAHARRCSPSSTGSATAPGRAERPGRAGAGGPRRRRSPAARALFGQRPAGRRGQLVPDLRRTLRAGVEAGALAGIVSGSGPTCAFLCADPDAAIDVATELTGAGVCRTVRRGARPGARRPRHRGPRARPPRRTQPRRPSRGPRSTPDGLGEPGQPRGGRRARAG